MLPDENLSLIKDATYPVLAGYSGKAMSDGGALLPPSSPSPGPTRHENISPDPSISVDPHEQAWRRLISHDEPSLIEIFLDRKAAEAIDCLQGGNIQVFIDVIYEVRPRIVHLRKMF